MTHLACPLCQKTHAQLRYTLREKRIFWCDLCRTFFIDPFPNALQLSALYEDSISEFNHKYFESFHDLRSRSFGRGLETLSQLGRHGSLLDIGTGLGFFLDQARRAGWGVEGFEFSHQTAQHARQTLGLPVHVGTLETASLAAGQYQVVTLWDVLEHLPNPLEALLRIRTLLVPEGLVVIRTPVCDSLIPWLLDLFYRLSGGRIRFGFEKLFKEHLFHFSEAGLHQLLEHCRFRLVRCYREDYIDFHALTRKEWAQHFGVRLGALAAILASHLLRRQDEIVLYAQSLSS